jgi:hypothetical protein
MESPERMLMVPSVGGFSAQISFNNVDLPDWSENHVKEEGRGGKGSQERRHLLRWVPPTRCARSGGCRS